MKWTGALASIAIHAAAFGAAVAAGGRRGAPAHATRGTPVFVEIVEAARERRESPDAPDRLKHLDSPKHLDRLDSPGQPDRPEPPPPVPNAPLAGSPAAQEVAPEELPKVAAEPRALNRIVPVYPRSARRRGHEGRATVEFSIGEDGGVSEARVAAASGHAELDAAALDAVRAARFEPVRGRGPAGPFRLTLDFKLR